jgi:hypothetical protein
MLQTELEEIKSYCMGLKALYDILSLRVLELEMAVVDLKEQVNTMKELLRYDGVAIEILKAKIKNK